MHQRVSKAQIKFKIPFNKPFIVGKELFYISQAVLEGNLAGDGRFTNLCTKWMEDKFKARKILLTTSCTAALEISAVLTDIKPGEEVIMPSFTFVSTANAFALRGAKIKFADIRSDTLNINENLIENMITKKTKAIVPVHYAGVACEMDKILEIANKFGLLVIEDAAQGVNATYKGRYLGTMGNLGTYSFHETKNFICGEGGALVVNDQRLIERAEIIREKGTNRSKFFRGEVDKYTWIDIGSSYLPSEIIAAFLYAQLEESDVITQKRWEIFNYYVKLFRPLQELGLLSIPSWPIECQHNAHMFYIILPDSSIRNKLLNFLNQHGIYAVFHYIPLHTSPMGLKMGYKKGDFPVTENISERLIRIPCFFELKQEEQNTIFETVKTFFSKKGNCKSLESRTKTYKF